MLGRTTVTPATKINYPLFNTWQVVIDRTLFTQMHIFSLPVALQVYQQISEPQRNRWFAFLSVPPDSSVKRAPISYAIYRWRGIHSLEFIFVILSQPIRLVVVYRTPPTFSRRYVLLDATLLMCCPVLWLLHNLFPYVISLTRAVNNVFVHLCQFPMQITLSIHVVFPLYLLLILLHTCFVSSSRLSSVSTQLQQMRGGWATAECAERPLILR